jgi:hypothetical protein
MTSLMANAIREIMDRDADSVKAKRRFLDRIERAPDRGTGGVIRWRREELHERRAGRVERRYGAVTVRNPFV